MGYTVLSTRAGLLLVAGTKRGLRLARFGSSERSLERALRASYPQGRLVRDAPWILPWSRALAGRLEENGRSSPLPLDVRGTPFQRKVWNLLTRIPRGSTVTYGELARSLGRPKGARAVAQACAANPVAVAIPCHRVIRSDGDPGGYRWGTAIKRKILAIESRQPSRAPAESRTTARFHARHPASLTREVRGRSLLAFGSKLKGFPLDRGRER
jgi:AraC family transcriptional regulator of adaptative response/methylated-DNA-[protein]-cysteine methyltransferase